MRLTATTVLTAAFGLCVTLVGIHTSPAATGKVFKPIIRKPMASGLGMLAHGKAIAQSNGCNTCHAPTYGGKKGFSPSIRASGITKKYTLKTWERVMNTGVTEDGGHVEKPMPVYHMAAKDSAPLYAYLKTLK